MLLPRILTAVIGVPVVLAAIHFGGVVYMAFVACVIALCSDSMGQGEQAMGKSAK